MFQQDWQVVTFDGNEKMKKKESTNKNYHHKNNSEDEPHLAVSSELKKAIIQARNAKSMTQKALAQQLGCDTKTIQSYENGSVIPNNKFIATMEKILSVKLPRAKRSTTAAND